jgi:hypothetical protein
VTAGSNLFLGSARDVVIERSLFQISENAAAAIIVAGGQGLDVSRNVFRDLDEGAAGDGRALTVQGYAGSVKDIYFADNVVDKLSPGVSHHNQNSGEQVLFETSSPWMMGEVTSSSGDETAIRPLKEYRRDGGVPDRLNVTIVSGRGAGQMRDLIRYKVGDSVIKVSPAWNVEPDGSSKLYIAALVHDVAVYRNKLTGKPDWQSRKTASVGVECFGDCRGVFVDGNTIDNVRYGVTIWSQSPRGGLPTTSYFNLVANNSITNAFEGIAVMSEYDRREVEGESFGALGNIFEDNKFSGVQRSEYVFRGCNEIAGWEESFNVIEDGGVSGLVRVIAESEEHPKGNRNVAGGGENIVAVISRSQEGMNIVSDSKGCVFRMFK